jgi:hypothetical protein
MTDNNDKIVKFEKENFYSIIVDKEKNRIFLTVVGVWTSPDQVPNYNSDMELAVKEVESGFSVLTTLAEDKPTKFGMTSLKKKNQQIMMDAGMAQAAVYLPGKQVLQKMTLNVVSKLTGMNVKVFSDRDEAIKWLGG